MARILRYGIGALIGDGDITTNKIADGAITNAKINAAAAIAKTKLSLNSFTGTGADGALSISSGTTTIDLGGAMVVVKNYTSISITGTGALAFSNPHANGTIIILKSQGGVTITSSANPVIDLRNLGSTGGAANSGLGYEPNCIGSNFLIADFGDSGGTGRGGGGAGGSNLIAKGGNGGDGEGGTLKGGTAAEFNFLGFSNIGSLWNRIITLGLAIGAGGGGGGRNTSAGGTGGAGGRGAGGLLISCGGALNFTTGTILATGTAGAAGAGGDSAAGGGGGAGGCVVMICETLTAATGTITVTGGAGGNGQSGAAGGAGGAKDTDGTAGAAGGSNQGGGGGGGAGGTYIVATNTDLL